MRLQDILHIRRVQLSQSRVNQCAHNAANHVPEKRRCLNFKQQQSRSHTLQPDPPDLPHRAHVFTLPGLK